MRGELTRQRRPGGPPQVPGAAPRGAQLAAGGVAEDGIKKEEDELQKLTDSYVSLINKVLEEKEKEILEV